MAYHPLAGQQFPQEIDTTLANNETSLSAEEVEASLPILYTLVEASVAVTATVGNLLVIVVFLQDRRLRKVTNFYIISLSVADFLVGAIGIPSAILTRIGMPRNSIRLCITMLSLLVVLCTISILNLVAVSLDRYWAILHPLDYHKRISEKTAMMIICFCWIIGSMIGFLPLFGWNNGHLASDECFFIPIMNYDFLMFLYFATIVLPAIIMAFFYIRIYIVVVQQLSLNKVRQLNCNELRLPRVKAPKGPLDKLPYSNQYAKNSMPLLKLSTPGIIPQKGIHRFKGYKSASSPQQLNEMVQPESRILPCHNGHLASDKSAGTSAEESPAHSLTSLTLSGRHLSALASTHSQLHLNRTEKVGKERKWRSLWIMGSTSPVDGYVSGEESSTEKKHSAATSILTSIYRAGNGSRLSYSRREVKKAQKLFIIVVYFMICWLPLYTSNTIQAFCHQNCPTPSPAWLDFLIILSHINSAGSPFLYAFHMKDFRQALRRLICMGAINKRKLRDLRREELFSISGRRAPSSGSVVNVFDPPGKLLPNQYLYKGRHDWRQVNSVEKGKPRNSVNSGQGYRQGPSHVHRVNTRQPCTVPKSSVKIEVEVEQLKEQALSCP